MRGPNFTHLVPLEKVQWTVQLHKLLRRFALLEILSMICLSLFKKSIFSLIPMTFLFVSATTISSSGSSSLMEVLDLHTQASEQSEQRVDGLELSISLSKRLFIPKERIFIEVELKNVGEETLLIKAVLSPIKNFLFFIENSKGEYRRWTISPDYEANMEYLTAKFLALKEGESFEEVVEVDPGIYGHLPPGEYTIFATYISEEINQSSVEKASGSYWAGKLKSNELKIKVESLK